MKRGLVYFLLAIVFAGWLGTLIARDSGYVLVSYNGATLQTSLWIALALILIVVVAGYYLLRLIKIIGQSTGYFQTWRGERKRSRAEELTVKGLTFFQAGEFDRAERFLKDGAASFKTAAVNYIFAAQAAERQGKAEEREAYLRKAVGGDAAVRQAVAVAGAEMALARGEFKRALDQLQDAGANERTALLKSKALIGAKDWQGLADIMPQIRKAYSPDEYNQLQKEIARERLSAEAMTDDGLAIVFKKLPDEVRTDPDIIALYCSRLGSEKEAEVAIRTALKKRWNPDLLVQYGGLGVETLTHRLKAAEGWLKQHADDAALQLCLGELYEASGDKEKAKTAYQKSVDLADLPVANANLGRLIAFDGDYKLGTQHLLRALAK
ncbi:MAG: heme biosynthesis HemY N-terminal domain-containing protein [Pseudomonadales bacterium]